MRVQRRWVAALCFATLTLHVAQTAQAAERLPPGHQGQGLEHAGQVRSYLLFLPSAAQDRSRALPLVLMLHGMGGTAANAVRETAWSVKAEQEGFVLAYADASRPDPQRPASLRNNPPAWNDGSGRFHAGAQQVDDTGFIRKLIDQVSAQQSIDPRRVYVTGFSNGASMAFRVGAELADRVAAIAPVAGASWAEAPQPVRGLSLIYLTGTADPLNPLEGGFPKLGQREQGGRAKKPVAEMIGTWTRALQCQPAKDLSAANANDNANGVQTRSFGGCKDGAEVVVITVEGLGHIWAGGESRLPEFMVGKPTNKLKATDVIWDFFRSHPMP
jgi:polyhydroxybutyrate depolymerase